MVCSRVLAGGVLAIVATFAISGNTLVVEHTGGETVRIMARTTILGGRYMIS